MEGLSLKEMAVNVTLNPRCSYNRCELLAWLSNTLHTSFSEVEQLSTGAAYCQLFHLLFPESLDLSMVRFQSTDILDSIHNFSLLEAAFKKVGVVRYIPIEALMKRNSLVSLPFLLWFKMFFDENKSSREDHAFKAGGGQSLLPDRSDELSSQGRQKTWSVLKMEIKEAEGLKKDFKNTPDGILMTSEHKKDGETVKDKMEAHVTESCAQLEGMKIITGSLAVDSEGQGKTSHTCETLLRFIRRYFGDSLHRNSSLTTDVSAILGPSHPEDIIQTCLHTPYCLYLYMGVELGPGQSTSVILVGYYDQSTGVSVVRLLDTLKMSVDTVGPQKSADVETDAFRVAPAKQSDAHLLTKLLNKHGLALSNLSVFYCDASDTETSQMFVSQLRAFNPVLVSLCGLPGMAERACQAGLFASFKRVVDLVGDIHHHYSNCPCVNDSLKEIFAHDKSYNPSRPLSEQCLFITRTVQNMVSKWKDLEDYFNSRSQEENLKLIRTQLTDNRVKLQFLFLSYSLEPLRALQELQQDRTANVAVELQLTAMLIHCYTSNIFRPSGAKHFLLRRDLHLLYDENQLLNTAEVNVGLRAKDFLQASTVMGIVQQEKNDFLKAAVAFYQASLKSLVQSLPERLSYVALRNISPMQNHLENRNYNNLSKPVLSELLVQLGVCSDGSSETIEQLSIDELRPDSTLHRLFHLILAIPGSLCRTEVFAKVLHNINGYSDSKEPPRATPQLNRLTRKPSIQRKKRPFQRHKRGKKDGSSSEGRSSKHCIPIEDSDDTDNSSDVVEVTAVSKTPRAFTPSIACGRTSPAHSIYVVTSDDEKVASTVTAPKSPELLGEVGELVWGKVEGFAVWPAVIKSASRDDRPQRKVVVEWFGQRMSSEISLQDLKPFASFGQHFCPNSFATLVTYQEAIFSSLQEAARRSKRQLSACADDKEELLRQMLDWAFGGFQPSGPDGFKPTTCTTVSKTDKRPDVKDRATSSTQSDTSTTETFSETSSTTSRDDKSTCQEDSHQTRTDSKEVVKKKKLDPGKREKGSSVEEEDDWETEWENVKRGWEREKGKTGSKGARRYKKKGNRFDEDTSPDFLPYKKKTCTKTYCKGNQLPRVYTQPDQKLRAETICRIAEQNLDIENFCLCCGTEDVVIFHPLFKGSLCLRCKDNFAETYYRYDDDGYQSYCTICCYGLEVVLCGNDSCCRSYCEYCLNILVGPGTFDALKEHDPWICYLCRPHQTHGALVPREDWSIRVQELFANNSAIAFEPHRVYPSIPASLRRPLRVLSLFDGIATGYLVLKELGFKVEKYVASEICEDSISVAEINHDGKIIHVGDSRFITQENLNQWGPFDLLIGGSPCNDLSIVNPIRKGLYEGTGRLFFEYYRILHLLKPKDEDPRPFFWLFENVVFMNTHDKVNICRFLECNPVLVNAVKVSPAHRARYFWGNIPGMSRPIIASQNDKVNLQDCLEIGRTARVTKVRTITTNPNSLKQGKDVSLLPVLQNDKEDNLWITELERIFGFPKHYTDVRNMNRQQRQKVLGKAWSVPVIRHLFAPLKDYFACEDPPSTTSSSSSSPPFQTLQHSSS